MLPDYVKPYESGVLIGLQFNLKMFLYEPTPVLHYF